MADFSSWLQDNWPNAIAAAGIIGGLLFTSASFRADAKNRLIKNLLALDERHRALWSEVKQRPELKRILSKNVDLLASPLTAEEDVSMWQIIQQFETGWRVEKILKRGELNLLARDVAEFFSLPIPRAVWERDKRCRSPRFVRFVEQALRKRNKTNLRQPNNEALPADEIIRAS
jgi:hypothetical protein